MSKVIFCTVKIYTENTWLNDKLLQLTQTCQRWWADHEYPCYTVDNYEDINQFSDQAEWIVVQTAGDIIIEQNHLWNKLHNIPDDVGMIGHVCWYSENIVPHLHPQCFIVRTSAIDHFDFDAVTATSKPFGRSTEDMHDGRSPLEVFLTNKPAQEYDFLFGTKLISQILIKGYRVVNFDKDWRFGSTTWPISSPNLSRLLEHALCPVLPSRGFCFPTNTTDKFAEALQTLTSRTDIDTSQQLLIELANQSIKLQNTNVVNLLHWDSIPNANTAQHVVATASGFLAELTALKTGAKSISFYDINPNTIEFKKSLYTEWDGEDYMSYATVWAEQRGLTIEPKWAKGQQLASLQNLDTVFDNWEYLKSLPKDFTCCDIVQDINVFVNLIKPDSVVHTSTILDYYIITALLHSVDEIQTARQLISESGCQWYET